MTDTLHAGTAFRLAAIAEQSTAKPAKLPSLKEARIIVPTGAGAATLANAEAAFLDRFGGFTRTNGIGGWRDGHGHPCVENTIVYDMAVPCTPDSAVKLRQIAVIIRLEGEQDCVYLRHYDGSVELV